MGVRSPSQQPRRFNPRARDGRELIGAECAPSVFVSIHAPVMDAKLPITDDVQQQLFQSTRP